MIFYHISELMMAMIKNHFISRLRDKLKYYRLSGATFYDCMTTIYQFIKPFLDNKMSIFEEYGDFKCLCYSLFIHCQLDSIAQWVASLTADQGVASSNSSSPHKFVEIDDGIISTVILLFPLIQEEQLSVTGNKFYLTA